MPKIIVTDNATTFCLQEFQNFVNENHIEHITSPPYQPSSNGAAENAAKNVKTALKNLIGSRCNKIQALLTFLIDYRNVAHCSTKVSPAEVMFGRKLHTRFDTFGNYSSC